MSGWRMSLVDIVASVDNLPDSFELDCWPYYRLLLHSLRPDYRTHGFIHPDTVLRMPWPKEFIIDHQERRVVLPESSEHPDPFQAAVDDAIESGLFPTANGMHSPPGCIPGAPGNYMTERFVAPLFGVATCGAHLTCYTDTPRGPSIWVARRSRFLSKYPGLFDSTVAVSIYDWDTRECLIKEALEKASLSPALVERHMRSAGTVTVANRDAETGLVCAKILYVFDLKLPADVVPRPRNGAVESFTLMDDFELRGSMEEGNLFKPSVYPVMVDFMLRHGLADEEGEFPLYEACMHLRRRLPMAIR